jgi:tRNA threonylcarbamoyladenosine biosynthesis protein TsaE
MRIGRSVPGGTVIALRGGLGAGKTALTKGIARGLGIEDEVTSPTYTIISEYEGRLRLHHVDAYRLSGPEDFSAIGGDELASDRGGLMVIEWSERITEALPPDAVTIELEVLEGDQRLARFSGPFDGSWLP